MEGTFVERDVTDEHYFKWIYNGRILWDHRNRGRLSAYEGKSTYAWDAPK